MSMVMVGPTAVCDRCSHQLRRHAIPDNERLSSRCLVKLQDGSPCPCDGYFPQRAA